MDRAAQHLEVAIEEGLPNAEVALRQGAYEKGRRVDFDDGVDPLSGALVALLWQRKPSLAVNWQPEIGIVQIKAQRPRGVLWLAWQKTGYRQLSISSGSIMPLKAPTSKNNQSLLTRYSRPITVLTINPASATTYLPGSASKRTL